MSLSCLEPPHQPQGTGTAHGTFPGLKPFPGKQCAPLCAGCPPWLPAVSPWHRKGPTASSRGHTELHRTVHPPQLSVAPLVWDAPRAGLSWCPGGRSTKPPAAVPAAGTGAAHASAPAGALGLAPRPSRAGPFPARAAGDQELCPLSHAQDTQLCSSLSMAAGPRGCKWRTGKCTGTRCRNNATLAAERSSTMY